MATVEAKGAEGEAVRLDEGSRLACGMHAP